MGLSRRQFTREFKLAAVRRLEQGVSIGEAARALEVNPNVLHRWRRELRQGPGNVFPGNGKQRWSEGRIAELERKVGRQGWMVNPKRVYRLLRGDNLLCIRKRKFLVTTDSDHGRRVYPNLAGQMSLTGINQLWVADITYMRLETEFVYLAVVIDAF